MKTLLLEINRVFWVQFHTHTWTWKLLAGLISLMTYKGSINLNFYYIADSTYKIKAEAPNMTGQEHGNVVDSGKPIIFYSLHLWTLGILEQREVKTKKMVKRAFATSSCVTSNPPSIISLSLILHPPWNPVPSCDVSILNLSLLGP